MEVVYNFQVVDRKKTTQPLITFPFQYSQCTPFQIGLCSTNRLWRIAVEFKVFASNHSSARKHMQLLKPPIGCYQPLHDDVESGLSVRLGGGPILSGKYGFV
jgi:hypothetical protein